MGKPTDELQAKLDEMGVEYTFDDSDDYEIIEWQGSYNLWWQFVYDPDEEEPYGELRLLEAGGATHLTPKQAIAVTVGKDIERYDGSGRRGTVAILQGGRKPEEVLFVRDEGGVTHYLPEDATVGAETCEFKPVEILSPRLRGRGNMLECTRCGYQYLQGFSSHERPEYCPSCGRKVVAE